jgi:co-chaperonin GroES (HSP10)
VAVLRATEVEARQHPAPHSGEAPAVGPGAREESGKRIDPDVHAGDTVLFGK